MDILYIGLVVAFVALSIGLVHGRARTEQETAMNWICVLSGVLAAGIGTCNI